MRCIVCRPDVYNLKTRKKLRTYIIGRAKLSLNENTTSPETEAMLDPMDMSEICCLI